MRAVKRTFARGEACDSRGRFTRVNHDSGFNREGLLHHKGISDCDERRVHPAEGDASVVGGDRHAKHTGLMSAERVHEFAVVHAPILDRAVAACGEDRRTVEGEDDGEHVVDVTDQGVQEFSVTDAPEAGGVVLSPGREQGSVGEKATQLTGPMCPASVVTSASRGSASASQILIVLSAFAEAMSAPSGEYARPVTTLACPPAIQAMFGRSARTSAGEPVAATRSRTNFAGTLRQFEIFDVSLWRSRRFCLPRTGDRPRLLCRRERRNLQDGSPDLAGWVVV